MNRRRFIKLLAALPFASLLPFVGKAEAAEAPKEYFINSGVFQLPGDSFVYGGRVAEAEPSPLFGVVEKVEGNKAWVRVGNWGEASTGYPSNRWVTFDDIGDSLEAGIDEVGQFVDNQLRIKTATEAVEIEKEAGLILQQLKRLT